MEAIQKGMHRGRGYPKRVATRYSTSCSTPIWQTRSQAGSKMNPSRKQYHWCGSCGDIHADNTCYVLLDIYQYPAPDVTVTLEVAEDMTLRRVSLPAEAKDGHRIDQRAYLGPIQYWACGFCMTLCESRVLYQEHVNQHLDGQGRSSKRWRHSFVILGLLQQNGLRQAWQSTVSNAMLFHKFRWDKDSTGRAPYWMSEYERGGQLQDYLERFQGSDIEAHSLAQLAFDLSCQAKWLRYKVSTTSNETAMAGKSAVVKAYYSAKPLPVIPRPSIKNTHNPMAKEDESSHVNSLQFDNIKISRPRNIAVNASSVHMEKTEMCPTKRRSSYHEDEVVLKKESKPPTYLEPCPSTTYSTSVTPNYALSRPHIAKLKIERMVSEAVSITHLSYRGLEAHIVNAVLQDVVTSVMQEFNTRWGQEVQQETACTNNRGSETNDDRKSANSKQGESSSISHSFSSHTTSTSKRKRSLCDSSGDDDGGNDEQPQQPSQVMEMDKLSSLGIKLACPFRKHDQTKYSLATHRVCAASGWGSIHRLKSVLVFFLKYPPKITLNYELYELIIGQRAPESLSQAYLLSKMQGNLQKQVCP